MNGAILWSGPSELDGRPVVLIATGFDKSSTNTKTGAMIQTWILVKNTAPLEAIHTGEDASICGDCRHRGTIVDGRNVGRSCYVNLGFAPRNIWASAERGIYDRVTLDQVEELGAGRVIRCGSYGDPACIPLEVWKRLLRRAAGHTGYTHAWRTADPEYSTFLMASADSPEDRAAAKFLGYRTFRVASELEDKAPGEVVCPASKEMGAKTDCASCKACGGLGSKAKADIFIVAHGPAGKVAAFKRAA